MPEIGEVARACHYLRKHLAGKTLAKVTAKHDENVYGKVGTSAAEFEKALTGKKVLDARQQGKYFWLVMSSPPHPLMHFGMAGWLKVKGEETSYYKPAKAEESEWPPKYWKFILQTKESPNTDVSYVDLRRFGRIRLIDCDANEIRNVSPLKENGPDPVQDTSIFTEDWLRDKVKSKHVPIKALLLDQGNISGIGNWVGDELLYDAKIHPEQYSDTLKEAQITQLFKSINYVCNFAVDCLSDSSKFPEGWLFKHRWGKGKKDAANTLPNGKRFVYVTVGGRTSAVVPSVQKKTGPVAGEVDVKAEEEADDGAAEGPGPGKLKKGKTKTKPVKREEKEAEEESKFDAKAHKTPAKRKKGAVADHDEVKVTVNGAKLTPEEAKPPAKKQKSSGKPKTKGDAPVSKPDTGGRRRSARISSG